MSNWRTPSANSRKRSAIFRERALQTGGSIDNFNAMRRYAVILFPLLLLCLLSPSLKAQPQERTTRILFVFDASNSMNAEWEDTPKIEVARDLLGQTLDSLKSVEKLQLGLRVYGHQYHVSSSQKNCDDTRLEVAFGDNTHDRIQRTIDEVDPKGTTPIARSIGKAADDFTGCDDCRNIIILITDGLEACGGNPCEVSHKLQKKGVVLKPFVIGVGLDEEMMEEFQCVGKFYDASNKRDFRKVLDVVISQALNNTTAQVNLLNANDRPKETNVPLTFYNRKSGRLDREIVHTMNNYGLPDTIEVDPLITYRVKAHTTPPVVNDSVHIEAGQHNIIPLKTPQGDLRIEFKGGARDLDGMDVLVRRKEDDHDPREILRVQRMNSEYRYLVGEYELEVLSLPRLTIDEVFVSQNHTTTVEVPIPGSALIKTNSPGHGAIFERKENGEREKVIDLERDTKQETVRLMPGKYSVTYRPAASKRSFYSKEKRFTIEEGRQTKVEF